MKKFFANCLAKPAGHQVQWINPKYLLEKAAVCKWGWLRWAVFISVNKGYG